jgi:hypothetical protein
VDAEGAVGAKLDVASAASLLGHVRPMSFWAQTGPIPVTSSSRAT